VASDSQWDQVAELTCRPGNGRVVSDNDGRSRTTVVAVPRTGLGNATASQRPGLATARETSTVSPTRRQRRQTGCSIRDVA